MDGIRHAGQPPLCVRHHEEVGKVCLGFLSFLRILQRNHHDARIPPGEVLGMSFELTELGHAEQSGPAPEEHERGILLTAKAVLVERGPIRQGGAERGDRGTDRHRTRVGRHFAE